MINRYRSSKAGRRSLFFGLFLAVIFCLPLQAAQEVVIAPQQIFAPGSRAFSVISVAQKMSKVTIILRRDRWPDTGGEVVKASIDLSLDGGQTWISPFIGLGAKGGDHLTKKGTLSLETKLWSKLPEPSNPDRKIRVVVQNSVYLKTAITVIFE
jgi:hypothetical protein